MSFLTVEAIKLPYAFIATIERPLLSLETITAFLSSRKIIVETLQLHAARFDEAILIIHCRIEKDRVKHIQYSMEKLGGILTLEVLESNVKHLNKSLNKINI
jgi:hypothetical protein